ncbi:MAG: hypothetical protein K5829_06740 [Treponema sp.]|nr:hypothetical protein [Treponema sp.]
MDNPDFIVEEKVYDWQSGQYPGFPKNEEGKYYCYQYYITNTSRKYKKYINTNIYYNKSDFSICNTYPVSCKADIQKLLNDDEFEEVNCLYGLSPSVLCLNKKSNNVVN